MLWDHLNSRLWFRVHPGTFSGSVSGLVCGGEQGDDGDVASEDPQAGFHLQSDTITARTD